VRQNTSDEPPLDIEKVLEHYGAHMVPRGGWRSMRCPFTMTGMRVLRFPQTMGHFGVTLAGSTGMP